MNISRWIAIGLTASLLFLCATPFWFSQYLTLVWLVIPVAWTCFFSYRSRHRLDSWLSFIFLLTVQFLSLYALRWEALSVEAAMAGVGSTTAFSFMFATLLLILNFCLFFPIMLNVWLLLKHSDASLFLTLLTWFIYPSLLLPIAALSGIDVYFANLRTFQDGFDASLVELPVSSIFTFGMPFAWVVPTMCLAPCCFLYHLYRLAQKRRLIGGAEPFL